MSYKSWEEKKMEKANFNTQIHTYILYYLGWLSTNSLLFRNAKSFEKCVLAMPKYE
jgi:hypothetical protein